MSAPRKPSIVFCHGIWAHGSCFSKLIPLLAAEGYEVISAQYNLDSAQSDIDAVIRTLDRVSSPSILVGHSYGGAVITGAGIDDRVLGLVYIAAVAPDEDETAASQQAKFPTTEVFMQIEVADGRVWMLPSASDASAEICPKQNSRSCGRRRRRPRRSCSLRSPQERLGGRSRALSLWPPRTRASTPTCTAPLPSGWAPRPTRSRVATARCSPIPTSCSTRSATS